jgi:hypothetical protein
MFPRPISRYVDLEAFTLAFIAISVFEKIAAQTNSTRLSTSRHLLIFAHRWIFLDVHGTDSLLLPKCLRELWLLALCEAGS